MRFFQVFNQTISSTEPIVMNATKSIVVSLTSLSKYDMKSVHHAQLQLHYLMSDVPLQCASSRNFLICSKGDTDESLMSCS